MQLIYCNTSIVTIGGPTIHTTICIQPHQLVQQTCTGHENFVRGNIMHYRYNSWSLVHSQAILNYLDFFDA